MATTYNVLTDTLGEQAILAHWERVTMNDVLGGRPTLTIDTYGGAPGMENVERLVTDMLVVRNDVNLMRARVVPITDTITADGNYTLQLNGVSYESLLEWRLLEAVPREYNNWLQAEIAWDLIQYSQLQNGGNLGITRGPAQGDLTVRRSRTFTALGAPIAKLLDDLGENDKGFDWWIDADKVFHMSSPHRGVDRTASVGLALGAQVESLKRTNMAEKYFNAIVVTGAQSEVTLPSGNTYPPPPPVFRESVHPRRGRWSRAIGYPDIVTAASLEAKADYELTRGIALRPTYSLHLATGAWDPNLFGLGDTVVVEIGARPRLDVVVPAQIVEIKVVITAAGEETVDLACVAVGDEFTGSTSGIPPDEDVLNPPPGSPTALLYSGGRTPGTIRLDEATELASSFEKMMSRIARLERGPS